MRGRVLTIAGSDSGGGAGIQADLKAITALGGFGMSAITALTAQNTCGVEGVHIVPPAFVRQQIDVVQKDLGIDCIKTGMLATAEIVNVVADVVSEFYTLPLILDPVIVSTSGVTLLSADAVEAIMSRLLVRATVVTPNIPEAERMTGVKIRDVEGMRTAAACLLEKGAQAVLLKGGHLPGGDLTDLLVTSRGEVLWSDARIETRHTHGTGCTLASAIATGIAQELSLEEAVTRARKYLRRAIANAPEYGSCSGPINHAVTIDPEWSAKSGN